MNCIYEMINCVCWFYSKDVQRLSRSQQLGSVMQERFELQSV